MGKIAVFSVLIAVLIAKVAWAYPGKYGAEEVDGGDKRAATKAVRHEAKVAEDPKAITAEEKRKLVTEKMKKARRFIGLAEKVLKVAPAIIASRQNLDKRRVENAMAALQFLRRRLDTLTGSTKEVIEQFLQKDFVGLHEDLKSFAKSAEKKVVENNKRKQWTTDSEYLNSRNSRFFNY